MVYKVKKEFNLGEGGCPLALELERMTVETSSP